MNAATNSATLLREFAEHRSETAFATLVRNHLDLVYSVAMRRGGNRTALAEEICQLVFIDLAGKAAGLPAGLSVAGWLHQHACFVAAKQLRAERRRHRREEIAMQLQTLADDTDWSRLAPVLDEALLELAAADRDPLVQRYFRQRSFAEIGASLGLGENAARMRVDRALDKLRAKLAKRGVTSTAAALAAALAGPAVTAAPSTLAATITTAALAAATTSMLGLLPLMASTKLKVAVATTLLAAAGTALVLQHQAGNRLRADNADLQRRVAQLAEETRVAQLTSAQSAEELARFRQTQTELLRLRGEVARLRSAQAQPTATKAAPGFDSSSATGHTAAPSQLADVGMDTPEDASTSLLWAVTTQQKDRFAELVKLPDDISEIEVSRHYDYLFRQMTNAYARWQFGSARRTEMKDDGTLKLYFEYRDLDTGRADELLVLLRKYDSAWKVVIDDVPRGDPSPPKE